MKTDIQTSLPDRSRIWIYMSDRKLSAGEVTRIREEGQKFVAGWNAHGNALFADIFVLYDHFVVLAADEQVAAASGCSIDKSMHFILNLQKEMGISLTNRLNIALLENNDVKLIPLSELIEKLKQGTIAPEQLFFDGTMGTLKQLRNEWVKPLSISWLNKFVPQKTTFS